MNKVITSFNLKPCVLHSPINANDQSYSSEKHSFTVETVVEGLENPWSVDFLPDGRILVTERPGRLRIVDNGQLVRTC